MPKLFNIGTLFLFVLCLSVVQLILYVWVCWKMPKVRYRDEVFRYIANQAQNGRISAKVLIALWWLISSAYYRLRLRRRKIPTARKAAIVPIRFSGCLKARPPSNTPLEFPP